MSDTNDLLTRVRQYVPTDPGVAACWSLLIKGIDVGWIDEGELRELQEHLCSRRDFGVEELLFAHVGDDLRVSFLDDEATCSQAAMTGLLDRVLRSDEAHL